VDIRECSPKSISRKKLIGRQEHNKRIVRTVALISVAALLCAGLIFPHIFFTYISSPSAEKAGIQSFEGTIDELNYTIQTSMLNDLEQNLRTLALIQVINDLSDENSGFLTVNADLLITNTGLVTTNNEFLTANDVTSEILTARADEITQLLERVESLETQSVNISGSMLQLAVLSTQIEEEQRNDFIEILQTPEATHEEVVEALFEPDLPVEAVDTFFDLDLSLEVIEYSSAIMTIFQSILDSFIDSLPTGFPTESRHITSHFGYRMHPILGIERLHGGIDLATPMNSEIRATAAGTVTRAEFHSGYGNLIIINHGHGIETLYAHNSENLVSVGQHVERGELIALSGSTGLSTGPHLHYEVRINGINHDPLNFLLDFGNSTEEFTECDEFCEDECCAMICVENCENEPCNGKFHEVPIDDFFG